jgi:hypothetical protein
MLTNCLAELIARRRNAIADPPRSSVSAMHHSDRQQRQRWPIDSRTWQKAAGVRRRAGRVTPGGKATPDSDKWYDGLTFMLDMTDLRRKAC